MDGAGGHDRPQLRALSSESQQMDTERRQQLWRYIPVKSTEKTVEPGMLSRLCQTNDYTWVNRLPL